MKIGLTGHTSGIGKHFADTCPYEIVGFSRSNGYDISLRSGRTKIIEDSHDCDVLINNAYYGFNQTNLLLEYYHAYKDERKLIVNIGSYATEVVLQQWQELLYYQSTKKSLLQLHDDLTQLDPVLKLGYVTFSYVGTERVLTKYPHLEEYISPTEAVQLYWEPINEFIK